MNRNQNRVCVANAKGGVGKSTSVLEIAAHASDMGYRVLVVDLDPQGNTSGVLLGTRPEKSLYHLLIEPDTTGVKEVLKKATAIWPNVWVIPATHQLSNAYKHIETLPDWSELVDDIISPIEDSFDLILLDTAPAMSTLTKMGMRAANKLMIPTSHDVFGDDGISAVMAMRDYYAKKNHHISLVKIFIAASQKLGASAHLKHSAMIKSAYPNMFIDIEFPHCTKIQDGKLLKPPQSGMSLLDPDHKLYRGYRRLTEIIMERQ